MDSEIMKVVLSVGVPLCSALTLVLACVNIGARVIAHNIALFHSAPQSWIQDDVYYTTEGATLLAKSKDGMYSYWVTPKGSFLRLFKNQWSNMKQKVPDAEIVKVLSYELPADEVSAIVELHLNKQLPRG